MRIQGAARSEKRRAAPLECKNRTEIETARLVLEAHENLVSADEANRTKFQDVLSFLRNRVDHK